MAGYEDTPNASGKRDGENGIFSQFARDSDGATTAVNNAFTDRQAQPHPGLPIGAATEERQENAREVFWWYADAGVGNANQQPPKHCWFQSRY
jgi:hypothetical protein